MEVQAECPWCGMVTLPPAEVRCATDPSSNEGLCEVTCPKCLRVVYARTTAQGVEIIQAAGAQPIVGLVPFELLERRSGPALDWDQLLDLLAALDSSACPQAEIFDALDRAKAGDTA
ncbi:MAG TPA: hypothetical protein VKX24_08620 [Acidimicrobiia bacterium]|nr:hypothetical protein [Acidimicrobiia bacterium]